MSARRLPGRILALTPGESGDASWPEVLQRARAAIAAGLDGILLREPALSDRATLELARELRSALGARGWLGIHDRVHLASAVGADAVHVGYRSLTIDAARRVLPDEVAVGFSAHAHDDPSAWSGADYLVFGPVFATPSKSGVLDPVGIDGVARATASTRIPLFALGGVDSTHVEQLVRAGSRGVAVRGALLGSTDPAAAWNRFAASARALPALDRAGTGPLPALDHATAAQGAHA